MAVSVAGRLIEWPGMLSALSRQALTFIDGGAQWLAWAMSVPSVRYAFADESALLSAVQDGLHASPYALLPTLGLQVSPIKLMTLGTGNLGVLAQAEGGDTSAVTAAQVQRILRNNDLVTSADLAAVPALLNQLGVAGAPVFQSSGLADALALYALACQSPAPGTAPTLLQEAAAFSIRQARTPMEFCDYYRAYLDLAPTDTDADTRLHVAESTLQTLLPQLFGALDCPQLPGLPSPAEVTHSVADWLARGRQIGFARISLAAQQIIQNTSFKASPGTPADAVQLYLQSAQSFLAAHRPGPGRLGQDGTTCLFTVSSSDHSATLQVRDGTISLIEFGVTAQDLTAGPVSDQGAPT